MSRAAHPRGARWGGARWAGWLLGALLGLVLALWAARPAVARSAAGSIPVVQMPVAPSIQGTPEQAERLGGALLWCAARLRGGRSMLESVDWSRLPKRCQVLVGRGRPLGPMVLLNGQTWNGAVRQMLHAVRRMPGDPVLVDGLLAVASLGRDRGWVETDRVLAREYARDRLLGLEGGASWYRVLMWARGPVAHGGLRDRWPNGVELPALDLQIAALHALPLAWRDVFRTTLERGLASRTGQIRLAAAQGLRDAVASDAPPLASIGALGRALRLESEPATALGITLALRDLLILGGEDGAADSRVPVKARVPLKDRAAAARHAASSLGQFGWRLDRVLVDVVGQEPIRAHVPVLIETLQRCDADSDAVLAAVAPGLVAAVRDAAHTVLCRWTGARWPADDPEKWASFWAQEQERMRFPAAVPDASVAQTSAAFYGVPVTGREVVFVLDISGSMAEQDGGGTDGQEAGASRLSRAVRQTLQAVRSMQPSDQIHLVSFESVARKHNKSPVQCTPEALASLEKALDTLVASGGTNLVAGIQSALGVDNSAGFGGPLTGQQVGVDEIFLLSDGEPSIGMVDAASILSLTRAWTANRDVRIHCVYVGPQPAPELMRDLAAAHGGVFVAR